MHGGHLSARLGQVTKLTEPRLREERVKHVEVVQSKNTGVCFRTAGLRGAFTSEDSWVQLVVLNKPLPNGWRACEALTEKRGINQMARINMKTFLH